MPPFECEWGFEGEGAEEEEGGGERTTQLPESSISVPFLVAGDFAGKLVLGGVGEDEMSVEAGGGEAAVAAAAGGGLAEGEEEEGEGEGSEEEVGGSDNELISFSA